MMHIYFRCDVTYVHFRFLFHQSRAVTMVRLLFQNGAAKTSMIVICYLYTILSKLTYLASFQELTEVTSCAGLLTSNKGALVNVNYPSEYLNAIDCNITIRVPGAAVIEIMFDYFHTESESDYNLLNAMCTLDYLEISDSNESYRICGHWAGKEHLLYFRFYASEIHLTFHSNEEYARAGYKLRWYSTPGQRHARPPKPCVSPLLETEQSRFEVISDPEIWEVGHNICRDRGAVLAQIDDETVHRALGRSLQDRNLSFTSFWIGANDQLFEGDYMWTDRSTVGFRNWFPGWLHVPDNGTRSTSQPSDDGFSNEDCVEIRRHFAYPGKGTGLTKSYFWNDRDCQVKNPFICQHEKQFGKRFKRYAPLDCNGVFNLTAESPSLVLTSPGFPDEYPRLLSCHVIIVAPSGFQIKFDFIHMHIEDAITRQGNSVDLPQNKGESCEFDNLTLANFPATRPRNHVTYCGDWNNGLKLLRWTSDVNTAILTFQTDNSKQFSGFSVNASIVSEGKVACNFSEQEDWIYGPSGCWQYSAQTQNQSEAEARCQTTDGSIADALDNVQFVGHMLEDQNTSSSCIDLWTNDSANSTSTNKSLSDSYLDEMCTVARICKKNTTGLIVPAYETTVIQAPCSFELPYICKRPKKRTDYQNVASIYTASSGSLSALCNYTNNENVTHVFEAHDNYRILMEISGFDIEYQENCLYDVLEIYGTNQDLRLCGYSLKTTTFLSKNSTVTLRFKSDNDATGCGFNMTWKWVRVNQTFDVTKTVSESGFISNVNFPMQFPDRLDGCFDIRAPVGDKRVILELSLLNLPGDGCADSFLEIHNISTDSAARFCGGNNMRNVSHFQPIFVSTRSEMTICFKAPSLDKDEGFMANFSQLSQDNGNLKRRLVIAPGDSVSVSSLMFPYGFPSGFCQEIELRTPIGHYLSFDSFQLKTVNRTNCSADSLNITDLSLSAEPEKLLFTSHCPYDDTDSSVHIPSSFLNFARITLQGGYHGNRISSIQFQALVSSVPDSEVLEKTVSTKGSFIGCEASTCRNHGQCTAAGSDRSTCSCTPQYRGLFCQTSMCDLRPCRHGNCSLSSTGFACTCKPNYWGERCDMDDVMCRWKQCTSHGRCVSINGTQTACLCDSQWTGPRCADTIPVIPENLTIGQKLLKEPIWIGMIVILNLVLFFCLSYIIRRKCGRKLSKYLPKRKKTTVSAVKEDSRAETSVSSHYLEIPRIHSRSTSPRLQILKSPLGDQSPTPSGPTTPGVDDRNREAALKLFDSYKANISGLSPSFSSADLESKVLMKSHVTDFRTSGIPKGRLSFSGSRATDGLDSHMGILRSYTINTGVQESRSRLNRLHRINKRNTYSESHSRRGRGDIERADICSDGDDGLEDITPAVHCFPEIKILNEDDTEQAKGSDSDTSIGVRTNPISQLNEGAAFNEKALELRRFSECIDSGYPSTAVSSSNTNPALQLESSERGQQPPLLSAGDRRKLYSSKAKSSSFYNITASNLSEKESSRNYFSLPEKRNVRELSVSRDLNPTDLERCRSCDKSRYDRGAVSCDSDLDFMSRRREIADTASYSRGIERHRRHRGHSTCCCQLHRCNSSRFHITSEPFRHSNCKHFHPLSSTSRYVNFADQQHSWKFSDSMNKISSSESEVYQRPRRHPKFKRKLYRDRRSKSSVRTKYDSADLDQQRRISRDFGEEETYKATMLRSFLSDTYQANVTGDLEKTVDDTLVDQIKDLTAIQNYSDDMLQAGSVPMHSPNSIVSNYGNEFEASGRDTSDNMEIIDLESGCGNMQNTDGTDNSVFGEDVKYNGTSAALSPGPNTKKMPLSCKLSLKDSAYQTKQSSVDKYAPILSKESLSSMPSQKASKKADTNTRPDDKVKRHLHQAALKLALLKRLQAKEQFSKDSAIHTFSEDDLSVDEVDTRHRPLVKRSSGSMLALQMKELNLSRVTEELSRETNTPTNEPQTERIDKSVTGIKSPSEIQMNELNKAKLSASKLNTLVTEETLV